MKLVQLVNVIEDKMLLVHHLQLQLMMKLLIKLLIMLILILDTKSVLQGASEGIELCIKTVVPALFPFIVLSTMLTSSLLGVRIGILQPFRRLLRLPKGGECLWFVGALGGYPVGAQCVGQALKTGQITAKEAKRMLSFCSNAGPSFIFGIGLGILGDVYLCFLAWIIHLLSSLVVGLLTQGNSSGYNIHTSSVPITLSEAVKKAIFTMSIICAWVILFRILITFLKKYISRKHSVSFQV